MGPEVGLEGAPHCAPDVDFLRLTQLMHPHCPEQSRIGWVRAEKSDLLGDKSVH